MKKSEFACLSARYLVLLIVALIFSLSALFYNIFLILTIYPANFLLNLFYDSFVIGSRIFVDSLSIEIIPACIAVSAYLLLLILNLTTSMNLRKRVYSLLFSFFLLLLVNILRIFIFSVLLVKNFYYFEEMHKFFWYFMSIIIVVGIWFLAVYLFKIQGIPIYSDFVFLSNKIKVKSKRKR